MSRRKYLINLYVDACMPETEEWTSMERRDCRQLAKTLTNDELRAAIGYAERAHGLKPANNDNI